MGGSGSEQITSDPDPVGRKLTDPMDPDQIVIFIFSPATVHQNIHMLRYTALYYTDMLNNNKGPHEIVHTVGIAKLDNRVINTTNSTYVR